jgi:hypothetical protein
VHRSFKSGFWVDLTVEQSLTCQGRMTKNKNCDKTKNDKTKKKRKEREEKTSSEDLEATDSQCKLDDSHYGTSMTAIVKMIRIVPSVISV